MKNISLKEALHIMEHNGVQLISCKPFELNEETITAIWVHILAAMHKASSSEE